MSGVQWLIDRFRSAANEDAIVWRGRTFTYSDLLDAVVDADTQLDAAGLAPGHSLILDADFAPTSIGLLVAALNRRCLVVPIASHVVAPRDEYAAIAQCLARFAIEDNRIIDIQKYQPDRSTSQPLLDQLRERRAPGLIFFTSGSTGKAKAAVHDFRSLTNKFQKRRHKQRLITFLLFDHIGGFNTMMYGMANCGCLITLADRDPASVLAAIEGHRAEVLPASPTFLNLLMVSGLADRYDLSSLKIINYATEVMPQTTLDRLRLHFPEVEFHQSYGLTEVGIMRSKPKPDGSVWLQVGGEDYQTKVEDGILYIKAKSSMLGYLNAPCPFDEDGWFCTGDEVEVSGEWFRFKGRKTDMINVGGEKVYPAEVEAVIVELEEVVDAVVRGEPHALVGNIVTACVELKDATAQDVMVRRIRKHCLSRLASFKVPVKISFEIPDGLMTARFKKQR